MSADSRAISGFSLKSIYLQAAALPAEARDGYFDALPDEHQRLVPEVQRMLAAAADNDLSAVGDQVGRLAHDAVAAATPMPEPSAASPIAGFRTLARLGEGGMGVVYLAEQAKPRRKVALKLIRPAAVSDALVRRFEREAEVLGLLNHPGIARVYQAGVVKTPRGPTPFLAMEYVEGRPLDAYAKAMPADPRARVTLLIDLCRAVHHAHTKGVIHRDLKPANILVTAAGEPKVLDFGVARVTGRGLSGATLATEAGAIVGTLAYMSPEQAAGRSSEVDTSSDVYALGVIGFELLSGKRPYDVTGKPLHEAVRVVCEAEPSRLSGVRKDLAGDLERVIAKAVRKDKAHRYASAFDLAADLENVLADRPVTARPPGAWYQFSKFARRNKGVVAGVATVAAALVVATLVSTSFAVHAGLQQRRAEAEQVEADRQADVARGALDGERRATAAAKRSAREAQDALENQRQAKLSAEQSARDARAALDGQIAASNAARDSAKTAEAALAAQRTAAAEAEKSAAVARRATGVADENTRQLERTIAFLSTSFGGAGIGGADGRNLTLKDALRAAERELDTAFQNDPPVAARLRRFVADASAFNGDYPSALRNVRLATKLTRDLYGPDSDRTLLAVLREAEIVNDAKDMPGAYDLLLKAYTSRGPAVGSPGTRSAVLNTLRHFAACMRRLPEADQWTEAIITIQRDSGDAGPALYSYACLLGSLAEQKKDADVLKRGREAMRLAIDAGAFGDESLDRVAAETGKVVGPADAAAFDALLQEAADKAARAAGPTAGSTLRVALNRADWLYTQHRDADAARIYNDAVARLQDRYGPAFEKFRALLIATRAENVDGPHRQELLGVRTLFQRMYNRGVEGGDGLDSFVPAAAYGPTLVAERSYAEAQRIFTATMASKRYASLPPEWKSLFVADLAEMKTALAPKKK